MRRNFAGGLFFVLVILGYLVMATAPTVAQSPSPTPTYDPLVEPLLSENPTELELGHNRYWLWCMTCHGDRGQGLTDEWRAVWEEDHQNCWGRGCHAGGRSAEDVFIIPTVVPMIIGPGQLEKFAVVQDLAAFLKLTHPPQHPGILTDEEYHAIAVYVFTMNGRLAGTETPTPSQAPTPTRTPAPSATSSPTPAPQPVGSPPVYSQAWPALVISVVALLVCGWALRRRAGQKQ